MSRLTQAGRSVASIHLFVGTKAQLIKMAPIMQELDRRGITYRFINAGQHAASISPLIEQFALRKPDITLHHSEENIANLRQGLAWIGKLVWQTIVGPEEIHRTVFGGCGGVVLIHGDTATTLISLLMAKRARLKVAHIEAGLRSFNIFDPFPEEMIRLIAMRYADLLFAPDEWAANNLRAMRVRGKISITHGNTMEDAVAYALSADPTTNSVNGKSPFAVMSIHRFETIRSRRRLQQIISLAAAIAEHKTVKFIVHSSTLAYLKRFNLLCRLESISGIQLLPLQPYVEFVKMLRGAAFIVTDGGSIQEESYVLGIPCLILREHTERHEGLGENAVLTGFDESRTSSFLEQFETLRRMPITFEPGQQRPSGQIVDDILRWLEEQSS